MDFDHLFTNARLPGRDGLVDLAVRDGRFAAVEPGLPPNGPSEDLGGRLVIPGFVETHLHLDKACLLGRCDCGAGSVGEAIAAVTAAKRGFTEADVYERARRVLERAVAQGTTRIRTHVEVDPRIGLTSFRALRRLKADYAWAVDLELCAFPQEGLLDDPGCEDVLVAALEEGADLVGGVPYIDRDADGHVARIFALARRFDVDIDFHLDFDLDPTWLRLDEVCRWADRTGWGGRVAIGHATKLSALPPEAFGRAARRLAGAGVAVTVLPATDLFLMGREAACNVPRGVAAAHRLARAGVTCSIATNNVLNPFTPYGDASLLRMANLYANVAQVSSEPDLALCLDLVTDQAARLMRCADYGLAPGRRADLVVLDARSPAEAVCTLAWPLQGMKNGRRSFARPMPLLSPPGEAARAPGPLLGPPLGPALGPALG
ncbi:Amidohydrolase 3 [Methylobacterium sp. 4-46]|nr:MULTISPECIES: amidohydrolase family protein [Methylobacterium]ACA17984.1 Amidohydrolase 3 [Methylobacterium sp. 4-46]WFT77285.1 amidohydrolase family protein [Methylobacterium nodulans]